MASPPAFGTHSRSAVEFSADITRPLLMVPENGSVVQLTAGGPPVGLFEDAAYDVGTVTMPETGTVLIYTDGVIEANNPADEEFGLARLIDLFAATHHSADGLLAAVMDAVRTWSSEREQGDDITLMALAVDDD